MQWDVRHGLLDPTPVSTVFMSRIMFGTDGVRGTPGTPPLADATVARLGAALATELGGAPRIVCGRDTRESGAGIERQLAAGIRGASGTLVSVGVMPTPGSRW